MDISPKVVQKFSEILPEYDAFILDMDGTIWDENDIFQEAFSTLKSILENGKSVFLITNRSNISRKTYHEKFIKHGLDIPIDHIYTCPFLSASYIKYKYPEVKKVYAIGETEFLNEIRDAGITVISGQEHDKLKVSTEEALQNLVVENVDAVVVGIDMMFNYYKLSYATICIDRGALFFASNEDHFWKYGGRKMPGTGALTSAISRSTLKEPIVLGKPNIYALDLILKSGEFEKKKILMIGDKLESDILFGKNAGIDTCLVLTGSTTSEMLDEEANKSDPILPKFVVKDLSL